MNAYIQVAFHKTLKKGDFTQQEMENLNKIYIFISSLYKNFKKYEQREIVSSLKNRIIKTSEKAFFITDTFLHVLSYNNDALN